MSKRSIFQQAEAISNKLMGELRTQGNDHMNKRQVERLLLAFRLLAEGLADILNIPYTDKTPLSTLLQRIHAIRKLPKPTRELLSGKFDLAHRKVRLRNPQVWEKAWHGRYREFLFYVSRYIPDKTGLTMNDLWFLFQHNGHSRIARILHGTGGRKPLELKGLEDAARYVLDIREQQAEQDKGKAP